MSRPLDADILVVGAGETGVAVASHLAVAGVRKIDVVDPERADEAARIVNALSTEVLAQPYPAAVDEANAGVLTLHRSCVVDATGEAKTRDLLEAVCAEHGAPFLSIEPRSGPASALRTAADALEAAG